MSKNSFLFLITALIFSCNTPSEINKDFNCKIASLNNLEIVEDVTNQFSIQIPKSWKTNLYKDAIQSSIFTADTTKQLTESTLLDVTFVNNNINFNEAFLLKQEQEQLTKKLIRIKHKEVKVLDKPSIYMIYKGKKGKYLFTTCHIFVKVDAQNFIQTKTSVYGDSLVNQRLCESLSRIETIKIH
ncbi:hypothetical protein [Polaribacter porphyrae]|uniref:PsbP C-terminal domain-containing protein n=1 Tax=Polaribacter porphyrae TaxID=1137780 RepID=A0A2S7WKF1_9FLAO|nr:hypothetical protein [Polaribacter porphyrae]PQJ78097.1 hypothetical protein BTO18_02320 [Polaribacter porphyrae]